MADAGDPHPTRRALRLVDDGVKTFDRNEADRADAPLLRAFLAGDEQAFGALVRRHQSTVLALLRRYAPDPDDARDLAQRAFIKAFEAARRSFWLRARGEVPFRAWLYRIAVNLGRNHVRDTRRWQRAPVGAADALPVQALGTAALERAERERALRASVLALPPRQREVLTLRIDAELPFREIAELLGITENNAKVHFHYAVRRLREIVAAGETP
ncbi:MAG TPA: sigma-70 family RNA polymerase sigma factor [Anaeromyxobacteraceae bacterium]|nr:sigma-70 family RNA polymerase sigma factor [Anaeromyxobacteraceae bacterium]